MILIQKNKRKPKQCINMVVFDCDHIKIIKRGKYVELFGNEGMIDR